MNPSSVVIKFVVFDDISCLGLLHERIEPDVVFGLSVGNVAEMAIKQVVVIKTYFEHLVHASGIVGDVTIGAYEERIGVLAIFVRPRGRL